MKPAILLTSDGHVFRGLAYGAQGFASGEVSIDSSVAGYCDALSLDQNTAKIVLFTSSHIGNVGVPESLDIHASGVALREGSRIASNWQAKGDLETALRSAGVVGIQGIDTRALVQLLVANPKLRVGIFSGEALPQDLGELGSSIPVPRAVITHMLKAIESEEN